jgi:hypothetical protein
VSDMAAPLLTRWFKIMDSDHPEEILDLIADDFGFSVVFSTGPGGAADFSGARRELEGYLEQRERGVRTHVVLSAATVGDDELVVGEVRRGNELEATFVAAARLDSAGRVRRLMIGRSPGVNFDVGAGKLDWGG